MNLIFDIGNVICRWDPEGLVRGVFSRPEQQHAALHGIIGHRDWHELDRGAITLEQAIDNASLRTSLPLDRIRALFEQTPPSLTPIASMVDLIRTLAYQGQSLYVLSNMQAHTWKYIEDRYDFWPLFRGIVISCQVRMIKPEPEIYRYITREYGLVPEDTLFLDDMEINVGAARAEGLDAICVRDVSQAIGEVRRVTGHGGSIGPL